MVSILFDLLTSKKIALSLIRVEKNSSKLGAKGTKRSGIFPKKSVFSAKNVFP